MKTIGLINPKKAVTKKTAKTTKKGDKNADA